MKGLRVSPGLMSEDWKFFSSWSLKQVFKSHYKEEGRRDILNMHKILFRKRGKSCKFSYLTNVYFQVILKSKLLFSICAPLKDFFMVLVLL